MWTYRYEYLFRLSANAATKNNEHLPAELRNSSSSGRSCCYVLVSLHLAGFSGWLYFFVDGLHYRTRHSLRRSTTSTANNGGFLVADVTGNIIDSMKEFESWMARPGQSTKRIPVVIRTRGVPHARIRPADQYLSRAGQYTTKHLSSSSTSSSTAASKFDIV